MLRIGLTGGIGSGKSTAADYFSSLGIPVIDADQIAHELTRAGTAATHAIIETFGPSVATPAGDLDRAALRQLVFADPRQRQRLENILHPLIREEMLKRSAAVEASYCILVTPLLIEKGWMPMYDRILVIDSPPEAQLQRAQKRDGLNELDIRQIMATQADRNTRLAMADDILRNDGDVHTLQRQIDALHHRYLELAR
jgi:dephospho-CoA kinase